MAASQAEPKHQLILVKDIIPTPDNPRTVRTESDSFKTLADSVRANGVRIPVIVRPHTDKNGKWDQRAGARRLAAAKLAGLKSIPALVYEDMTDEAAFDITFLENFARQDLTVLEEAQAVASLLEKNAGDVKAVADKFDKSEKWIRRRANVHGNLSDKWLVCIANIDNMKAVFGDRERADNIRHFGIGHFALIARFDKDVQDHILEDVICEDMTIKELDKDCGTLLMDLSTAIWDITSNEIDVTETVCECPACDQCHNRTGHQPLLWDDDPKKGKVDRCLDPACWKDHMAAALDEKLAVAKVKYEGIKLLTTGYSYTENREIAKRLGDLLEAPDVQNAKKSDKDAFPCFVVRGKQVGKVVWKKTAKSGSPARSGKPSGPTPLRQRRQGLKSMRWCAVLRLMHTIIGQLPLAEIQNEDKQLVIMSLAAHIGIRTIHRRMDCWKSFADTVSKGRDHVMGILWPMVRSEIQADLSYGGAATRLPNHYIDKAKTVIKLLGLSESDLWADACKEKPEPQSWAKLKEDGTPKPVKKLKVKPKAKKAKK